MKRLKNTLILGITLYYLMPLSAMAVTPEEVAAVGKEQSAAGVFVWFLCAIAFLKVSQKIDSFMASLGVTVWMFDGCFRTHDASTTNFNPGKGWGILFSDMTHIGREGLCGLLPLHTSGHTHTASGNGCCDIVCKVSAFVEGGFIDFPADRI